METKRTKYQKLAVKEMLRWQKKMLQQPGAFSRFTIKTQKKLNSFIPGKVHQSITFVLKNMIQLVTEGSGWTTPKQIVSKNLAELEFEVREKMKFYKRTAAIEGGVTGAGGFLASMADFPILLSLKIKLLFEIAHLYGFDTKLKSERVFILYVFQLAFSSQLHRNQLMQEFENFVNTLNQEDLNYKNLDWLQLQQQYRDYIDLAKIAQLLPVVGAPVGLIANFTLTQKLGNTAMQAYRYRLYLQNKL